AGVRHAAVGAGEHPQADQGTRRRALVRAGWVYSRADAGDGGRPPRRRACVRRRPVAPRHPRGERPRRHVLHGGAADAGRGAARGGGGGGAARERVPADARVPAGWGARVMAGDLAVTVTAPAASAVLAAPAFVAEWEHERVSDSVETTQND